MRYVLDASAALCWVLPRPFSAKALRLRDDHRAKIHQLIAPAHFPHEIASGLTKAERQKLIPVGDARKLVEDVLRAAPVLHATGPLFYRAVDISSQSRSGYYDCLYVALAEREGCELLTADERLRNSLGQQFPFVVLLSSL
jgi:predicted nucleic acid-binding protein